MRYFTPGQVYHSEGNGGTRTIDYLGGLGAVDPEFERSLNFYRNGLTSLGAGNVVAKLDSVFASFLGLKRTVRNVLAVLNEAEKTGNLIVSESSKLADYWGTCPSCYFGTGREAFVNTLNETRAVVASQIEAARTVKGILSQQPLNTSLPREGRSLAVELMTYNLAYRAAKLAAATDKFRKDNPYLTAYNFEALFSAVASSLKIVTGTLASAIEKIVKAVVTPVTDLVPNLAGVIPWWVWATGAGILAIWALPKVATISRVFR